MKKLPLYLLALLVALSCERTITLEDDGKRSLTLNAIMSTGDTLHTAFVAWSGFDGISLIEQARLKCYVNGIPRAESSALKGYEAPQTIRFKARIKPGDKVRLILETPGGDRAEAAVTAPDPAKITQVDTAIFTMIPHGGKRPVKCVEFLTTVEDLPGRDNFYRVRAFTESALVLNVPGPHESHVPGDTISHSGRLELAIINTREPLLNNGIRFPLRDEYTYTSDYYDNAFNIFRDEGFKDSTADLKLITEANFYRSQPYYIESTYISKTRATIRLESMDRETFSYLNYVQYASSTLAEFTLNLPLIINGNVSGGDGFVGVVSSSDYVFDFADWHIDKAGDMNNKPI